MSERSIAVAEKAPVPLLSPVQGGILQRQCACGQHTMGGECEACKKKKMPLQRKFNGLAGPAWAIVHEVLRSPGQELDAETRRFMEQGFKREVVPSRVVPNHRSTQPGPNPESSSDVLEKEAGSIADRVMSFNTIRRNDQAGEFVRKASYSPGTHDFSRVRVHTDSRAAESAKTLNAQAYTIGEAIVFGDGYYSPGSPGGRHLIAHELAHVAQQNLIGPRLARAKLDLPRVDQELFWGRPLTQDEGEIGSGATPKSPEGDPSLPIKAFVYPRNVVDLPKQEPEHSADSTSRGQGGQEGDVRESPAISRDEELNRPGSARRVWSGGPKESQWRFTPKGLLVPARRALVVAGIHGDEEGPRDLVKQLQTELSSGSNPLARDFDTIVIPDANPGGHRHQAITGKPPDKTRENLMGVDLNRNFPGVQGFPSLPEKSPLKKPLQPEVKAIIDVVKTIHPERILSLHAIEDPRHEKGGAFADPVEADVSRQLACRMALRMRGQRNINVKGNKLDAGICNTRYPETSDVSVTQQQSSLGAWASASARVGGEGIPVITHEVTSAQKPDPLPPSGAGRSVEAIMPGIREFLLDNEHLPSEADALLRQSVSEAFLTGELVAKPADDRTLQAVVSVVSARFEDMNQHYMKVWLPQQPADVRKKLPRRLASNNEFRPFAGPKGQAGIASGALAKHALFKASSTDEEIKQAIFSVMTTISLPGFSRHAWGTEIDLDPPVRSKWEGPDAPSAPLIPFLKSEAFRFGFYHPYSDQRLSAALPHYENEPWHISYWPLAMALQEEYLKRIDGVVLQNLIARTAKAVHGPIDEKRITSILAGMDLRSFQRNVAPPPK